MTRLAVVALAGLSAIVLLAAMVVASSAFSLATERQVAYEYLDEAILSPERLQPIVDWQPATTALARDVTAVEHEVVGRAMTEAWSAYTAAQHLGQTAMLADYFSGVALERAQQAAHTAHKTGTRMVVLSISAEPVFYHLDGSVLQVRAQSLTARYAKAEDGALAQFRLTHDTTLTTLMNESSGWRVFSHERQDVRPVAARTTPHIDKINQLAGINYYPADTPWRAFWANFDTEVIAQDFGRIRDLGANSIRVFLPRDVFLEETGKESALVNLQILLDLAAEFDLSVVPTLFDLRPGYDLTGWPDDLRYLQGVLPVLKGHRAVAFVDLKNEPDLDFAPHGRARVEAWLRTMIALHHEMAPELALTIGWASHVDALTLADQLDVLSYHDYAAVDQSAARLKAIRGKADGKPVMITEIGESSYSALGDWPGSPRMQAVRLQDRLAAMAQSDGVFIWTLNDFPDPDAEAVGHSLWVRNLQSSFGLFDPAGRPKPAAKTVATFFETFLKGARIE